MDQYLLILLIVFGLSWIYFQNRFYFNSRSVLVDRSIFLSIFLLLWVSFGSRVEIGGDWANYENYFEYSLNNSFEYILGNKGFIYFSLMKIFNLLGLSFYDFNFITTGLILFILVRFLAVFQVETEGLFLVAGIFCVVLISGFSRQALAVACFLAVITNYMKGVRWPFFVGVSILGCLIHVSFVIVVPFLIALVWKRGVIVAGGVCLFGLSIALATQIALEAVIVSKGVFLRLALISIPFLFFTYFVNLRNVDPRLVKIYWLSLIFISLIGLSAIIYPVFFFDRFLYFFLPLSILFSALIMKDAKSIAVFFSPIGLHWGFTIFWLLFSGNAGAWLPLKFGVFF